LIIVNGICALRACLNAFGGKRLKSGSEEEPKRRKREKKVKSKNEK
jgi:hypothetical protein